MNLWRKIDELTAAYGRLADQRAALWSTMQRYRMAGNERPAVTVENKLHMLDCQGLALAERIDDLCMAALDMPADERPRF